MKHLHMSLLVMLIALVIPYATAEETPSHTTFTFSEDGVTVTAGSSTGYKITGTDITVNGSGIYVFTGECSNGTIKVKKETTDVKLVLAGLTLAADGTAPLCCNSGTEVKILVQKGTTNKLSDSVTNNDDLYPKNENAENAVIKLKARSNVAIYGTGKLIVEANGKNGIKSGAEAQLRIQDAEIQITTTVNDGISCDNLLLLESGMLTINSASEGIKCDPDATEDTASQGKAVIYGGSIAITSTGDGIDATGPVIILNGIIDITTGGGSTGTVGADDSKKGIKSTSLLGITGGTFTMNCADDAFHTNNTMLITDGTFLVATGDDAFHADLTLVLGIKDAAVGPHITIDTCYEGIEAAYIYFCSGDIDITASDDGVNAANSNVRDHKLVVYGGSIYCNASGDGFDSNNLTFIYGGDIQIFGATNGNNAALDSDGTIACHGGTLIAVGYSDMAQAPLASYSTQSCVTFGSSSSMIGPGGGQGGGQPGGQPGGQGRIVPGGRITPGGGGSWGSTNNLSIKSGNTLVVMDASNNTLYSTSAVKTANNVVFSSADLTANSTYYLYVNGTKTAQATAQRIATSSYTKLAVPEISLAYTAAADLPAIEDDSDDSLVPLREITLLTFTADGITVTQGPDSTYSINGTALSLNGAGTYEITGSCPDGTIDIGKGVTGLTLLLNGLTLTSSSTAPILLGKDADVTLTVMGSNNLSDSEANAKNEKAVIKAKSNTNLTLNGNGSLTITAKGKNGLKAGAGGILTLDGASLSITAPNDAISADHELVITSGTYILTAGGDAIKAEPDEEDTDSFGAITIQGGKFMLVSEDDGIQSAGDLTISGGNLTIQAKGCGINCGKTCAFAADTETPSITVIASSTVLKAVSFVRSNAILHGTASQSGIVADSIVLDTGSTELFVANEDNGIAISPWTLTAGTLFIASNTASTTSTSVSCLLFQGAVTAQDIIAITDADGDTLLSTTATQDSTNFLFADATLATSGTFTLWRNNIATATCLSETEVNISQTIPYGWSMIYLLVMPDDSLLSHLHFYLYQNMAIVPSNTPVLKTPYFIYNDGVPILLEGKASVSTDIPLENGWNFIGIPLETKVTNTISAWEWNGTAFVPITDTLTQGKAYWIKQDNN